jgi:hypothetical protein
MAQGNTDVLMSHQILYSGRSTPTLADGARKRMSQVVSEIRQANLPTARSNAERNERYGVPCRLQKTGPVAAVPILTTFRVVVNTVFIGTLRLSPFLA